MNCALHPSGLRSFLFAWPPEEPPIPTIEDTEECFRKVKSSGEDIAESVQKGWT